jgi:hypothetical protein
MICTSTLDQPFRDVEVWVMFAICSFKGSFERFNLRALHDVGLVVFGKKHTDIAPSLFDFGIYDFPVL